MNRKERIAELEEYASCYGVQILGDALSIIKDLESELRTAKHDSICNDASTKALVSQIKELEEESKLNQWQPIETAPKDGSNYLGIMTGEAFICFYDEDEGHICEYQTEVRPHVPLLWMPLPTKPKDQ